VTDDVVDALAFGVATSPRLVGSRVVARTAGGVVDVGALADRGLVTDGGSAAGHSWWRSGRLDDFLAAGHTAWQQVTGELDADVHGALDDDDPALMDDPHLQLPVTIGDYVDFYASEHHASNLGKLLRPGQDPLSPNWKHMPIGYHGRSGTVVVSGTPVRRPSGQRRPGEDGMPPFGPTERLDVEVEVGFVIGVPSQHGIPVPVTDFASHVFGVCLVNDWSARDIQLWEGQPLGPFLGKSFATSMSPWLVPLDVLAPAVVPVASADSPLSPYLRESFPAGLDLSLSLSINGTVVSRPPFATMFWSPAQMLAHMTVNGASVRTGDLYASGTVSGVDRDQWGSLAELSDMGTTPITLADGSTRTFLEDGDEVVITATAPGAGGVVLSLGEVRGKVLSPGGAPQG
jgi:fumarylacetoacetase